MNWILLGRSRNLAVVLTANGEVHTHEDAQVFVHDLNLSVTVQVLDDTPAFLSLGNFCEEHGYTYEWVSGQKTTVDQRGEDNPNCTCREKNHFSIPMKYIDVTGRWEDT